MKRVYSDVDIYWEEAPRKEQHGCAIVVTFRGRGRRPWMRIIPSIKWLNTDIENLTGIINHESVHICLWDHVGMEACEALDNLPPPMSFDEFFPGVWGLNKRGEKPSK